MKTVTKYSLSLFTFLFVLVGAQEAFSQIQTPVKWHFTVNRISDTEAELLLKATIENDWHVYSTNQESADGPISLTFNFEKNKNYVLDGKINEPTPEKMYDKNFEMNVKFYEHEVIYKQKVKILAQDAFSIKGVLNFQTCNSSMCLPPTDVDFEFKIGGKGEIPAQGQILKPVKWDFSVNKISDAEAELILKASIEKGWHMYSMSQEKGVAPPTAITFDFEKNNKYQLTGRIDEPKPFTEYDKGAEMNTYFFKDQVTFKQKIKLLSANPFAVKGALHFQVCSDVCIYGDENFEFPINGMVGTSNGLPDSTALTKTDTATSGAIVEDDKFNDSCGSMGGEDYAGMSAWTIFIQGLLGGFLALLTPCVFSMIPLTVSFFIRQSPDRATGMKNASIYSLSIVLIYVATGYIITKLFGPDTLNKMASDVWFNLAFFIIFIVFAVSFFGAFEISLPSSWSNRADRAADKGGLIGIFFMAFTLSLVSFSCTGPIIGTLLVQTAVGGNNLGPLLGMAGFAIALAFPFALFAAFPAWLNSLPKSGGWLNSVKVSLGFIELALALKFFSNVDLAYHWGLLKREIFIALWIIIFGLWGLYLLGKLKLAHDSEVKHLSIPRLLISMVVLSFTLYLIPGLWVSPLKLISGFPPPDFYKEWNQGKSDGGHCPHDLPCFHDYDEGMTYAKNQGKPVMLDFTGWSCVNCRKMEDNVWGDPEVLKRLREKYVLISLYVDDKTPLPENEQTVSKTTGNKISNQGNKWSDLQTSVYKTNSQPYYVLIDNNAKKLARPRGGYNPDVNIFMKFLDEGLCRYESRK